VDVLLQQKTDMLEDAIDAATRSSVANTATISNLSSDLTDVQEDEPATKQDRVTQVCSPGYSIRAIADDGSVVCEADDSTALLTSYTTNRRASQYYSNNYYAYYAVAYCASGYTMSGGGFYKSSSGLRLRYSRPNGNTGWAVYTEYTPYSGSLYAYARCIRFI